MSALKNVVGLMLAASVLVSSTAALADHGDKAEKKADHGSKGGNGAAAPELAGKGAPAALALIACGAAIVVSRRRRQS